MFSLHPPASAEDHRAALSGVGKAFTQYGPVEFLRQAGKPVPAEINAQRSCSGGGTSSSAIVRDISERKRTEVKLAASEELLRIIVEGTLDMFFFVHDTAGTFTYLSPSVVKITGYGPEHWKSRYREFLTAGSRQRRREGLCRPGAEGRGCGAHVHLRGASRRQGGPCSWRSTRSRYSRKGR